MWMVYSLQSVILSANENENVSVFLGKITKWFAHEETWVYSSYKQ